MEKEKIRAAREKTGESSIKKKPMEKSMSRRRNIKSATQVAHSKTTGDFNTSNCSGVEVSKPHPYETGSKEPGTTKRLIFKNFSYGRPRLH